MLPLDVKSGQVSSNYMRFFKELEKIQALGPKTTLLPLLSRSQGKAAGQQWGGTLETIPRGLDVTRLDCRTAGVSVSVGSTWPSPRLKT